MCEDVDGIELQAESEDDNKDEYKAFTEYTLMLRSMLYPKQTIEFKQVWSIYSCKRSSVNRMAAGSRLQVQVMDFFFFHLIFKHALCS